MQTRSIVSHELGQNSLLAALPSCVVDSWLPHLESVEMRAGEVVYEPGATLNQVYFPTTAIVSLLYVLRNGASAEIAVVGYEGIVGVSLFMGGMSTLSRAVVQSGGQLVIGAILPVFRPWFTIGSAVFSSVFVIKQRPESFVVIVIG